MQAAGRSGLRSQQTLVETGLLPVAGLAVCAEYPQVHPCYGLPGQLGEQGCATVEVRRLGLQARSLQDGRLHQGDGHGGGSVENFPFVSNVVAGVLVARVDGELLFTAQHQYGSAVQHQWPQRAQFGLGQRVERLVGLHGWQNAQWVALGVVQQRSAGYRQVGDAPGAQQVAEIDHALQLPLALGITGPHGVVVGDVQVHGLAWQVINQRHQALSGLAGGVFDAGALPAVLQYRQQMIDQRLGMLRVPLQGARKAWVVEIGQGLVQLRTEPAQLSHQVWLHVLETGQRLAFDVIEQPQAQWLFVDVQFQQPHAVVGQAYGGYRQTLLAQEGQGGVLRFKFQLGIAAMAGLQHIATLGRGHAKVQVLLAAQHRRLPATP